jgi:hypothetical protein
MSTEAAGSEELFKLLADVKRLAQRYYELTGGRSLGVTGEVAEYEAARLLDDVELAPPRERGYDAVRRVRNRDQLLQIKGRCIQPDSKSGQRIGRIYLDKPWDVALMVLLNERYETTAIYEATRPDLEPSLREYEKKAKEKARSVEGMPVTRFKELGRRIWPRQKE